VQKGGLGIEEFRKFNLGKGDLSSYSVEVRELLKRCNTYEAGDEELVRLPRFISVSKERHVDLRQGLKHEVCRVVVVEEANPSLPANSRSWCSITLEDSEISSDILGRILLVYPPGHVLWALLDCFIALNDELLAAKASSFTTHQHLYCPIIQGYPGFISIISGNSTSDDLAANLDTCREVAAFRVKGNTPDLAALSATTVVPAPPADSCCES
jgi:hypothetical protein